MWFFRRHREKQAEIQKIRTELFKTADDAKESVEKINKLLDDPELGITGYIFYAAGGDKRIKKGKK